MRRVLAALGLSAVFAGCGGSSSNASADDGIVLSQLPAELGKSFCAAEKACNPFLYGFAFKETDCVSLVTQQFTQASYNDLQAAVSAGTIKYDARLARTCADEIASGGCTVLDNTTPDSCFQALSGLAATGEACDLDQECAGVARCETSGNSCPGHCAPRASAGVACKVGGDCVRGTVCSPITQKCVAPGQVGDECGGNVAGSCAAGLLCIGDDQDNRRAGKCQTATSVLVGQAGDSCDLQAGPWCAAGLACVVQSASLGKLSAQCEAPAASGGGCGVAVPSQCPQGEYCPVTVADLAAGHNSASCTPLPAEGAACAPALAFARCAGDLVCDTTTTPAQPVCIKRRDLGEPCSDSTLCYSQHCTAGACAPAGPCAR